MSASGNALLKELFDEIPEVTDKELPPKKEQEEFLETQIDQLKKAIYRYTTEVEAGKYYYEKGMEIGDNNAKELGKSKIQEAGSNLKGTLWVLDCMKKLRVDLVEPKEK